MGSHNQNKMGETRVGIFQVKCFQFAVLVPFPYSGFSSFMYVFIKISKQDCDFLLATKAVID